MNKTAIKNFAVEARNILIQSSMQMAYEYEIEDGKPLDANQSSVGDRALSDTEFSQRKQLVCRIGEQGFQSVMEEVAYTWFNRFTALRFMEVNGYLPSKVRVFTDEDGNFKPMILKEALTVEIDGIDREKILALIDKQDNENLYKYLLITQCNALNQCLPEMFEKFGGWTELLFPANLLREGSIIDRMVSDIPEGDWKEQVQIIGWLYQYYNTEPKDKVFANLKKNIKISKENIPAATQLFTPDWIVRYMVENSLGRLWVDGHEDFDKSEWKYYLEEAEQEESVKAQLDSIKAEYKGISPEEIRFIDPCMGSGHILVYAFDVLMQIYVSQGWSERDAAVSIVENNLYGLDIDKRAYQLAYFALMMKGRSYNRRFLSRGIKPNLCYFSDMGGIDSSNIGNAKLREFAEQFRNADTYGSLLEVKSCDIGEIESLIPEMKLTMFNEGYPEKLNKMVSAYKILSQKYDVVCTNPPYMGSSGMNVLLSDFVKKNYPDSKSDLFAVFMERCGQLSRKYYAMITQHAFMFLSSYENLRKKMLMQTIINMAHLGARAFDEIGGEVVQTTAFVNSQKHLKNYEGSYVRLVDIVGENQKKKAFFSGEHRYTANQSNFSKIPGSPVAYWVSNELLRSFDKGEILKIKGDTRQGMATSDNNRFLRHWYEVNYGKLGLECGCAEEAVQIRKKWYPYNKGGEFRKWYGNIDYVINYENDGDEVKKYATSLYKTPTRTIKSISEYFKHCLSWSKISSGNIAFRYYPKGFIFDVAGCCIFYNDYNIMFYDFGFINSKIAKIILDVISPTLNYEAGHIASLPIIRKKDLIVVVGSISQSNIQLAKNDWNSFETSWDFKRHPLI